MTPVPGLRVSVVTPPYPAVITDARLLLPVRPPKVGVVALLRVTVPAPEVSRVLFCRARLLANVRMPALTVVVPL